MVGESNGREYNPEEYECKYSFRDNEEDILLDTSIVTFRAFLRTFDETILVQRQIDSVLSRFNRYFLGRAARARLRQEPCTPSDEAIASIPIARGRSGDIEEKTEDQG